MKEERNHLLKQMDELKATITQYENHIGELEHELEDSINENM